MQSNEQCNVGWWWARERDNNWSGFSSTADPLPSDASELISLKSFTIRTKQFLHLCHPFAFPLWQSSLWNNLGWNLPANPRQWQRGYLISGKTPWGGMGDSHPRKPTQLVWPHGVGSLPREGLKVFHYKLQTDARPGLGTQQATTAERVRGQLTPWSFNLRPCTC